MKLVSGVGTNDADYPVVIEATIGGRRKRLWACPIYRTWHNMLTRCYDAKRLAKFPTYSGCSVSTEWLSFSAFRAWMIERQWEGRHLDKDILFHGNKVYGPDACVLVTGELNNFMTDHGSARGEWPIGAYWNKRDGKFRAQCRNPFTRKNEYLGVFVCHVSASQAWRARKHELACLYADQQTDMRIAQALRARYLTGEVKP